MNVKDKVYVVTGGAQGIGLALFPAGGEVSRDADVEHLAAATVERLQQTLARTREAEEASGR
jgi:hypothetical protein